MNAKSFWQLLGLNSAQRALYEHIVAHPLADSAERAAELALNPPEVEAAAQRLLALRLVRRTPQGVEAIEPRTAVTALARSHQALLDQAGLIADDLAGTFATARTLSSAGQLTQALRADEIPGRLVDMLTSATTSVDATAAPPFVSGADPEVEAAEQRLLARGIPFRAIYDSSALESSDQLANIKTAIERGEHARVLPALTTKMIIVDSSVALLPLNSAPHDGQIHAIVINRSSISEALSVLFQHLWDRATPLVLEGDTLPSEDQVGPDRQLLILLNTGMTDQAIAGHLGISERTFRRRVSILQKQLSASTRFQLGSIAAQRRMLPVRRSR